MTAVRVPSRISELAPDQTDATISVGAGGASGDLIVEANGVERARFTFAEGSGGVLQVGTPFGGTSTGTKILATTSYVYSGGAAGQTSGVRSQALIKGTSPSGPTNRYHALTVQVGDASSVVNKTITAVANNGAGLFRITAASHGFSNGESVGIENVGGYSAASAPNGQWLVANVTTNTFDLAGSTYAAGYTSGGTVTNRGSYYGLMVTTTPTVARSGLIGTSATHGDDIAGVAFYNAAASAIKSGDGIYFGHNPAFTNGASEWIDGLSVAANVDYGVILSGWVNNYGIDMASAVFPSGAHAIRLPNNVAVVGRNAANSADVLVFKLDTNNRVQFLAPLQIPDSVNINFGTSTGSLIGTSASQMFAFWGKTPIAQPTTSITGATRVGGGGTTVTTADTFGGYTLAQLAAIIKNTGLAA